MNRSKPPSRRCGDAASPTARRAAQKCLAALLSGHCLTEEAVLYAAMALGDHKAHSADAYAEQSGAEVQTAGLTINRNTAKALGLTFAQSLLLRADEVIE